MAEEVLVARVAHRLVLGLERVEQGFERHLRVDDDVLAARQPDDDIRPEQPVV